MHKLYESEVVCMWSTHEEIKLALTLKWKYHDFIAELRLIT